MSNGVELPSGYCGPDCTIDNSICDFCQYFYNLTAWHENMEACECSRELGRHEGWCVRHNRETGITDSCDGFLCFRLGRVDHAAPKHGTPAGAALVAHIGEFMPDSP